MDCFFCKLIKDDKNPSFIKSYKFGKLYINIDQFYEGRVLYIYNKHYDDITQIDSNDLSASVLEIKEISYKLKMYLKGDLINICALGNEVQHLHWHIISRKKDDGNWGKPPWPHSARPIKEFEQKELSEKLKKILD